MLVLLLLVTGSLCQVWDDPAWRADRPEFFWEPVEADHRFNPFENDIVRGESTRLSPKHPFKQSIKYFETTLPLPEMSARRFKERARARGTRNIYYYGDQQQLSRASDAMPIITSYDPERHHKEKLNMDSKLLADATNLAKSLGRTTMRVRTFPELDARRATTTPLPKTTSTGSPKRSPQKVTVKFPSTTRKSAIVHQPVSAIVAPIGAPIPRPIAPLAPGMQPTLPQIPQQVLPQLSPPVQLPQPPLPPPPALPLAAPVQPLPTAPSQLPPQLGPPPPPPLPQLQPQADPIINSQAPNASLEQLGCGFDIISNSCKDVFALGWCGHCHDFGNIFLHDCKCVQPLISIVQLQQQLAQQAAVAGGAAGVPTIPVTPGGSH